MTPAITRGDLLAVEDMSVTVAIAQVLRGEEPSPNTAIMAILALARLLGEHDWTKVGDA